MSKSNFWLSKEILMGFALIVLIVAPVIAFGGSKVIYVDDDAKGNADGSAAHPYKTISKALSKAKSGNEVRIKNGDYKENITIPKNVKVVGDRENREKVIIKADNKSEPVVTMKDDGELSHVTVRDGKHGIRIGGGAEAHVYNVVVKSNSKDGISIQSAPRDKKHMAIIDQVQINGNGRAGIYSEKRKVLVMNSQIGSNGSDGIDFEAGVEAWVADNHVSYNRGSGMVFVVDGSTIGSKNNKIIGNRNQGIEINSYGAPGTVNVKKANIRDNGFYGIAKLARTTSALTHFGSVNFDDGVNANKLENNKKGAVSGILRSF